MVSEDFMRILGPLRLLEKESGIKVERETAILLVEALSAFKCHDEVLVHDEAESDAG